jgi:hypothetical protein
VGRKRLGRDADPSPPSSAEVQKQSSAIPLLSLSALVACKKDETFLLANGVTCHTVVTVYLLSSNLKVHKKAEKLTMSIDKISI